MQETPQYPNRLRFFIDAAGYHMCEVAKEADISERTLRDWAAGNRVIPHRSRIALARVLGRRIEEFAPLQTSPQYMIQLPEKRNRLQEQDEMEKKRRELLKLLGIASGVLLMPIHDIDWERIDDAVETPSHVNTAVLQELSTVNRHWWGIYRAASSKSRVLDGVLGQFKTLTSFLKGSHSAPIHTRLAILASDLAQLAGEIFFDANEYGVAASCYTFAMATAKEASHYDLWACALVRNAFLPLYEQNYQDASLLLRQAQQVALRGDPSLVTRQWIAAVSAETYAGLGDVTACQKALDASEEVHSMRRGGNGGWLRFDGERLPEQRGTCFVRLRQPNLALPALYEALSQHPDPTRRRGMVLCEMAQASLQQQNIEQACAYTHEVIEITACSSSGMLKKGLFTLRAQLEPLAYSEAVRQLDQHLSTLA
jgi:transcriptional regulator with XRE-family HTH domain